MNDRTSTLQAISALDDQVVELTKSTAESGHALYCRFASIINSLSIAIESAEKNGVDKEAIKSAIKRSRKIFSLSPYVGRIQEWPRGYQGDFETVEHIQNGIASCGLGDLSSCIEYYAQMLPVTQQHRNKLVHQERLARLAVLGNRNILSVGCGGALDLQKALEGVPDYTGTISCIDMDQDALDLVAQRTMGYNINILNKNIVRGVGQEKDNFYQLIVCGGLFDYLDDRVAGMLLRQLQKKLTSDGKIFLTNIASGNPFRIQMEYMCDWVLIERSESDIERLVKESLSGPFDVICVRDVTGLAILSTIEARQQESSAA